MPGIVKNDLENKVFGRLTVLKLSGNIKNGQAMWLCRCSCDGKIIEVSRSSLMSNNKKSCGCLHIENARKQGENSVKHGEYVGKNKHSKEYDCWCSIKYRCYNPNCKDYKYYGARGITMDEKWIHDFGKFLEYVGRAPSKEYTIDRLDNDKGYIEGNVAWKLMYEQNRNKRGKRKSNLIIDDVKKIKEYLYKKEYSMKELSEMFKVSEGVIQCIKYRKSWKHVSIDIKEKGE